MTVPGDLYSLIAAFLDKEGSAAAAAAVRADAKKKGVQMKPAGGADLFAIYTAHVQQHGGCVWPWWWGQPPMLNSDTVAPPLTQPLHCAQPEAPG